MSKHYLFMNISFEEVDHILFVFVLLRLIKVDHVEALLVYEY